MRVNLRLDSQYQFNYMSHYNYVVDNLKKGQQKSTENAFTIYC